MADHSFSAVQNALEQRVTEELTKQPNRSTVSLNFAALEDGDGKNIAEVVSMGDDDASEIADGADVSTFDADTEHMASLGWTILHTAFAVTGLAEAASKNEPNALRNTPLYKLMEAGQRLASTANKRYIQGTGAGSPAQALGLTTSAGPLDSTGTYASIDRSVETQWQGNVFSNSGVNRAISKDLLDSALDDIYEACGAQPEYGVTSPSVWRQIANLVEDKQRYVRDVTVKGQEIVLPAGQQAITWDGIPIFKDKDWKAGTFSWLNPKYVGAKFLTPPPDLVDGDVIASVPIAGTPQEQAGTARDSRGLQAKLIRLARTGDKRKIALYLYWQVFCRKPRAQALIEDLIP